MGIDLKGGMELAPWAACFARLAFTPDQASQLFRDAVTRLNERAARMVAEGKRVWEPTPDDPALIIIADEYAELPEDAQKSADSVAWRGRAVRSTLIAATRRPAQAAMGKNTAVRSQMDIRICLRVREPRDADLILGQGSVTSGWHAHKLTKPGQFLISGPDHAMPERNRAYLPTDGRRDHHAAVTEQPDSSGYVFCYELLRAAARGEFIGLPAVLRGWLDLSEKIIATLLVPISAFCDTSQQAAPTSTAPGRPGDPGHYRPGRRLNVTSPGQACSR